MILDALGTSLGYYFFGEDSPPVPAIAVLPDSQYGYYYPPRGVIASGIEAVIILPYPDAKMRLGNGSMRKKKWEIHLKQWDANGDLLSAADLLLDGIQKQGYRHTDITYVSPDLDAGIIPSCRIAIIEQYLKT